MNGAFGPSLLSLMNKTFYLSHSRVKLTQGNMGHFKKKIPIKANLGQHGYCYMKNTLRCGFAVNVVRVLPREYAYLHLKLNVRTQYANKTQGSKASNTTQELKKTNKHLELISCILAHPDGCVLCGAPTQWLKKVALKDVELAPSQRTTAAAWIYDGFPW